MYDFKTVRKTLKQLKEFNYKFEKTSKVTGIKTSTIRDWYNKENLVISFIKRNKESPLIYQTLFL